MLLNQQESIVINHLKCNAYRNTSLSNWDSLSHSKREKVQCVPVPFICVRSWGIFYGMFRQQCSILRRLFFYVFLLMLPH